MNCAGCAASSRARDNRRFDHGDRRDTRNLRNLRGDFARRIACGVVPGMFVDDGDRRRRSGPIHQRQSHSRLRHARLTKARRGIFSASSRRSRRVLLPRRRCMPLWVRRMQVWAKRRLLSRKDKKPWPCNRVSKIHSRGPTKRKSWRVSMLYWAMPITQFPCSNGYSRRRIAFRLLRHCCKLIQCGSKSGTILAFRNWSQKIKPEIEEDFGAIARSALRGTHSMVWS
jgi:hypothetical protein